MSSRYYFNSSISDGQSWSHLRAFVVHKRLLIVLLSSEEHLISSIEISIKNSSSQAFRGSTKTRRKSRIQSKIISLIRSNNLMFSPPSRIFPLFRNLLNEFTQNCHKRRLEWSYIIHIFCMEIWGTFFRIMGMGLRNAASRLNPGWTTIRAMKEKNRMDFVFGLGWGWGGARGWRASHRRTIWLPKWSLCVLFVHLHTLIQGRPFSKTSIRLVDRPSVPIRGCTWGGVPLRSYLIYRALMRESGLLHPSLLV